MQDGTLALGSMVDKAIARSIDALKTQNPALAQQVIDADEEINSARWELEEGAVHLIATQAPMAGDLRQIMAIDHIASELERMADYAKVIARYTIQTSSEPPLKPLIEIPKMADLCREMLVDALDAFVEHDAEKALQTANKDEAIDLLWDQVYRELLTIMISDPTTVPKASDLLWVAHNLERVGDRITNICERIIFMVTGRFEEIIPL